MTLEGFMRHARSHKRHSSGVSFLLQCGNEFRESPFATQPAPSDSVTGVTVQSTLVCSIARLAWWGGAAATRRVAVVLVAAAISIAATCAATAQVVWPPIPASEEPWNAQSVLEPVPFVRQWERKGADEVLPEDTPVNTRVQPGYEPRGARLGVWMFEPSVTMGSYYSSNVFSSPTDKRGDL